MNKQTQFPTTFNGVLITSMSTPLLNQLKARAVAYRENCTARAQEPKQEYIDLEAAVDAELEARTGTVKQCWDEFARLRGEVIALGYTVPSLSNAVGIAEVREVIALLRESIAVLVPLPDEDPAIAQHARDGVQLDIIARVSALNEKYDKRYPIEEILKCQTTHTTAS